MTDNLLGPTKHEIAATLSGAILRLGKDDLDGARAQLDRATRELDAFREVREHKKKQANLFKEGPHGPEEQDKNFNK